MASETILSVKDLRVRFQTLDGTIEAVKGISIKVNAGETVAVVGESGSGKSQTMMAAMNLLSSNGEATGHVDYRGQNLLTMTKGQLNQVRGRKISMIFQEPMTSLDPLYTIGNQLIEPIRRHRGLSARAAREEALKLLKLVHIPDPARRMKSYPHEMSGGQRQRVMIAMALANDPDILIADEPTTALDVTIQAQILQLLMDIRRERGLSIILITHDLGIVAQTCDRIAVMREGRLVEQGNKRDLLRSPSHPYTKALIGSHPSMPPATGERAAPTSPSNAATGKPLLEVDDLNVRFAGAGSLFGGRSGAVHAVAGVSLKILPGETVGIVGESGSGKSTLARAILGLTPIASGNVTFDGTSLRDDRVAFLARLRRETAMVFQDPYNALNPRLPIGEMLAEVLKVQGRTPSAEISARVGELLDLVDLGREFAGRRPRSMSGGQCQRAGIARALAVEPRLIIADESTAALDVTIQAQILDLFRVLKRKMNLTLLFIAHDLAIVRNLCDRVVVMHRGHIVEQGGSAQVFEHPADPYTQALIRAIPDIDPDKPLLPQAAREVA